MESTSKAAQPIQPTLGGIGPNRPCCLAGGFRGNTSTILKITYLKSGRFRDQNGKYHIFVHSTSTYTSL